MGNYTDDRERASLEQMSPERWQFVQTGCGEHVWYWCTSWAGCPVGRQKLRMELDRI